MKTSRNYQCLRYIRHTPSDFSKLFLVGISRVEDKARWFENLCNSVQSNCEEFIFTLCIYHKAKCIFSAYSLRVKFLRKDMMIVTKYILNNFFLPCISLIRSFLLFIFNSNQAFINKEEKETDQSRAYYKINVLLIDVSIVIHLWLFLITISENGKHKQAINLYSS